MGEVRSGDRRVAQSLIAFFRLLRVMRGKTKQPSHRQAKGEGEAGSMDSFVRDMSAQKECFQRHE
jgi:hypothetical protein